MPERLRRALPAVGLLGLCYIPLLLTSPGQVVADTKSYLYIDPGRMLTRATSIWDPHVALGTVTHQTIGKLWPMAPYYWAMEELGLPDWAAQRLWLGSIMAVAGFGVWFLLRTWCWRGPSVAVAVVAYACTPYILTIAVRISALLLPYVALPWMIALVSRAVRSGSWRHPAVFALIVTTVGTNNATAIILAGIGPLLWVAWELLRREHAATRVLAAVGRIGVLTAITNAWWIVGLSVQATNGIDVTSYTESVGTTAAASAAQEVLRGLGYWFFYGDDAVGPWVGPSRQYQTAALLLAITFAIPAVALLGGAVARWTHRAFVVALTFVGLLLAVGVYPYDDPPPFGRALRAFLLTDLGRAMRSLPRAAPLAVLGLAVLLGAGVHAVVRRWPRRALPVAGAFIVLLVAALPPHWRLQMAPENLRRPEDLPAYWADATGHLYRTDDGTRVLEVPGTDFTSYRWGTTLDPVSPFLMERPMVARQLEPMGSEAAVNLLKALDTRLQNHVAEPTSLAPIARLMRAGDLLVRSDLAFEHYDTPRPRELWAFLQETPGLGQPEAFGPPGPNIAAEPNPMLDELELSLDPHLEDPPPVAVIPVEDAPPIVTLKPAATPVVVAGDGDGLVDSAIAGLIDGTELVRYSAAMTADELDAALEDGAVLVLTDSNRRRGERWGNIRYTNGYTEPAGLEPLRRDPTDARLPVFTSGDDARTVAQHEGGVSANATSYGVRNSFLPYARPANAIDGDPTTAWRAGLDDPVVGERIELTFDAPLTTSSLTFLAPLEYINRWVTRVALRFDGGDPVDVDLDDTSRSQPGQRVEIGTRTFEHLSVEILADSVGPRPRYGGLTSTGFAEIGVADTVLDEVIRLPVDLLGRSGARADERPLAVVLTRQRTTPTDVVHDDEERFLVRSFSLPSARSFRLDGAARVSARTDDARLSRLLDQPGSVTATSSERLAGRAHRASAAVDGDLDTAWSTGFGTLPGEHLELRREAPAPLDRLALDVVADGRHSVPTRVRVEADGRAVATVDVPAISDQASPGATTRVSLELPQPTTATQVRLVIEETRDVITRRWSSHAEIEMPVALAEVDWAGARIVPRRGELASGCRDDLLTVDGRPLSIRITGDVSDAEDGDPLAIAWCDDEGLELTAGDHVLRAADGRTTGIDLDRLVLRSAAGGRPSTSTGTLREEAEGPTTAPRVEVVSRTADALSLQVTGATPGEPVWLAFGEGFESGWTADGEGRSLGASSLVDGFANGWRIDPTTESFAVSLRFEPQRRVEVALWLSAAGALLCLVLAARGRRPVAAEAVPEPFSAASVAGPALPPLGLGAAAGLSLIFAIGVTLIVGPVVGLLTGALAAVCALGLVPRWLTLGVPVAAMTFSGAWVTQAVLRHDVAPGLEWVSELTRAHPIAWFAVLALLVDVVVHAARRRA